MGIMSKKVVKIVIFALVMGLFVPELPFMYIGIIVLAEDISIRI
jgi:hypothetical protein